MQIMYKKICNINLRDHFFGTRPIDDNETLQSSRLSPEHAVLLSFLAHRLSPLDFKTRSCKQQCRNSAFVSE